MARGVVLVTGGAGYIGSHMVLALLDEGRPVVVLDDLSTGTRALVPTEVTFEQGDVGDSKLVANLIRRHEIRSVIHFAGSAIVVESMRDPLKYYRNNAIAGMCLVGVCAREGVESFILSSTCAVYGIPQEIPIAEDQPKDPVSPYGATKLAVERMVRDVASIGGPNFGILRYFNVAGADPAGRTGQVSRTSTHLIKVACEAAVGKRSAVEIYGEDYDTPDGTCIRDYVHVSDLVEAHRLALHHLEGNGSDLTLNCGYGHGYSVREILEVTARVAGVDLEIRAAGRRPGDPPCLVADNSRLTSTLDWRPRFEDIHEIIRSALDWERRLARVEAPRSPHSPQTRPMPRIKE